MPRKRKFQPPDVTDVPALVEVEWVDAVYDTEHDGPASGAGGLALLPSCGYHVRNGIDPKHGRFVVIAREWSKATSGELHSRHEITIHIDWIRKWSVVAELREVWPVCQAPGTSISVESAISTAKVENASTISSLAMNAGVNPSASESILPS